MISQVNTRVNGSVKQDPITINKTMSDALTSLVVYELGFGGYITSLDPDRVVVKTRVLHCVDTTVFSGSQEEMEFLFRVALAHSKLVQDHHGELMNATLKVWDKVAGGMSGVPLLIAAGSPIVMGSISIIQSLAWAFDVNDEKEAKFMVDFMGGSGLPQSKQQEDLVAALLLRRETGAKLWEIVEVT